MGPSPQCYIPSHKVIGPLVLEKKIFEGFLPYMGMAAILVMWPRPRERTFIPPSHWGSIWNLVLIGQAVLEKKIFENGGRRTDVDEPWLYYKLTNELSKGSGELKNTTFVEANVMNIFAKFQLHLPYGFWEDDFWIFFHKFSLSVTNQIQQFGQNSYMFGRELLKEHFCKTFVKISTMR